MTSTQITTKAYKRLCDYKFANGKTCHYQEDGFRVYLNLIDCFGLYNRCGLNKLNEVFFEVTIIGDYIVRGSAIYAKTIRIDEKLNLTKFLNGKFTNKNGNEYHYKNGELHRDGDLPAVIASDGTQEWYKNDVHHRDGDLPAVIGNNGSQEWWKNGKRHRDAGLPAIMLFHGKQEWHENGKLLHENTKFIDPISSDGTQKFYYENGYYHTMSSCGIQKFYYKDKIFRMMKHDGSVENYDNCGNITHVELPRIVG